MCCPVTPEMAGGAPLVIERGSLLELGAVALLSLLAYVGFSLVKLLLSNRMTPAAEANVTDLRRERNTPGESDKNGAPD